MPLLGLVPSRLGLAATRDEHQNRALSHSPHASASASASASTSKTYTVGLITIEQDVYRVSTTYALKLHHFSSVYGLYGLF